MCSRYGCSSTSCSSCPMTSPWRPSASFASIDSSIAATRRSSRRAISACAKGSYARSASGAPRQRASARSSASRARSGLPGAELPPAVVDQPLEPVRVDLLELDLQLVAVLARHEDIRRKLLAEARDVHLKGLQRVRRRALAPELVDQALARERLVGMQQENGEDRPALVSPERDLPGPVKGLQRAENAKVHASAAVAAMAQRYRPVTALSPRGNRPPAPSQLDGNEVHHTGGSHGTGHSPPAPRSRSSQPVQDGRRTALCRHRRDRGPGHCCCDRGERRQQRFDLRAAEHPPATDPASGHPLRRRPG